MKFTAKIAAFSALSVASAMAPVIAGTFDYNEETHLVFMREEEKLARDVYLTLADMYPGSSVFQNIAETSEQTHTDTMKAKLDQYGVADPNPDTNNLPAAIGVFTGADYGAYFTEKFNILVNCPANSEHDAQYAGASIEELDMHDIVLCPKAIVEADNGVGDEECGLTYTDENPIINTYESLLAGSENHLRSYVGQIEAIIGAGNYVAQYLPQETVDAILGR